MKGTFVQETNGQKRQTTKDEGGGEGPQQNNNKRTARAQRSSHYHQAHTPIRHKEPHIIQVQLPPLPQKSAPRDLGVKVNTHMHTYIDTYIYIYIARGTNLSRRENEREDYWKGREQDRGTEKNGGRREGFVGECIHLCA